MKYALLLALSAIAWADTPDEMLARAKTAVPIVERIRDRKFKTPVTMRVLTDEEVRKSFVEGFDEEFPVEEAAGFEAAYARLGLIPDDMDLRAFLIDLHVSEVAAFYDEKKRELCLIESMKDDPEDEGTVKWSDMVAVHELTHALQDQFHGLEAIDKNRLVDEDGDVSHALGCVVEGEAMLVMLTRYYEANGVGLPDPEGLEELAQKMMTGSEEGSKMAEAPRYLRESLVSPYAIGLRFVAEVQAQDGWAGVSELFTSIPASSEMVLHPRKYLSDDRDYPMEMLVPDLSAELPKGFKEVARDSLGEFGTRVRLQELEASDHAAETASEGWDGDGFVAWNDGNKAHTVVAWATTWDSDGDARQFFYALRDGLAKRWKVAKSEIPRGEDAYAWKTPIGGVAIELRGKDVISIEGHLGDTEAASAFLEKVAEKLEKKEILSVIDDPSSEAPAKEEKK